MLKHEIISHAESEFALWWAEMQAKKMVEIDERHLCLMAMLKGMDVGLDIAKGKLEDQQPC